MISLAEQERFEIFVSHRDATVSARPVRAPGNSRQNARPPQLKRLSSTLRLAASSCR